MTEQTIKDQNEKLQNIISDCTNDRKCIADLIAELEEPTDKLKIKYGTRFDPLSESYLIRLIRSYTTNELDSDFLLASCGLLKGYENIPNKINRQIKYAGITGVGGKRKPINQQRDPSKTLRKKEKNIIRGIVDLLISQLGKPENGGRLNLLAEVSADYELPVPALLHNSTIKPFWDVS